MPTKRIDYNGGINTRARLGTTPDGQIFTSDNFLIIGASLNLRNGAFKVGTVSASNIYNIGIYYGGGGAEWLLMVDSTNHRILQLKNSSFDVITDITPGGGSPTGDGNFDVLNNVLFYGDNTTGLYKWSGTGTMTAVGGSSPASCNIIKVVNNFLFASNLLAPSAIVWSNASDGTTWSSASSLDFRKGDGDVITALSSLGQDLIIFKGHSIGRLSTQTISVSGTVTLGPLTTIAEGIGCAGPRAVDHLPDGRIVFVGTDSHVYIFDGSVAQDISDQPYPGPNIQGDLFGFSGFSTTVFVRTYSLRQEVWICFFKQIIFIYNYATNSWSTRTNSTITSFSQLYSVVGFSSFNSTVTHCINNQTALVSADSSGNLWIEDSTSGNRSAPTSTIEISVPIPADTRPNYKRFVVIPMFGGSSQTVTYYTGIDGTYGSSNTFTLTSGYDRLQIAIPAVSKETFILIKITYATFTALSIDPAYISDEVVQ